MTQPIMIGIAGLAGSGKDTLAAFIKEAADLSEYNLGVQIMGFADPIRSIAKHLGFKLDREHKEKKDSLIFFDFDDRLFRAIDAVIGECMFEDERARLFSRTLQVLAEKGWLEADALFCSPREFMQVFGTEIGQVALGPDVWVKHLRLRARLTDAYCVIVPDVRFPHECDDLDYLVCVERDVAGVATHASETHMMTLAQLSDNNIANSGSLLDLRNIAETLAHDWVFPNAS